MRHPTRLAAALAGVLLAGAISLLGAAPSGASGLPKVPPCMSQAGPCNGIFIKSVGVGIQQDTSARKGVFKLKGPVPLQFTQDVSCGDMRCLRNHLDWIIGEGGVRASGCQQNTTTCNVKRAKGATGWVPVLVNQNDFPVALFVLYSPPRGQVVISGTVRQRQCVKNISPCALDVVPDAGRGVVATGPHGTIDTDTADDGSFGFQVRKGVYRVHVPGSANSVKPAARRVTAHADVGGVDFSVCKTPPGYTGAKPACGLLEVDGTVVDLDSDPFPGVTVEVPGDVATTDAYGNYTLLGAPGTNLVSARDFSNGFAIPTASTLDSLSAPVTFEQKLKLMPAFGASQITQTSVVLQFAGLSPTVNHGGEHAMIVQQGPPSPACPAQQSVGLSSTVTRGGVANFTPPAGTTSYCTGQYAVSLLAANGATLVQAVIRIP